MYKQKTTRNNRFKTTFVLSCLTASVLLGASIISLTPQKIKAASPEQGQQLVEINESNFPDEKFRSYILEKVDGGGMNNSNPSLSFAKDGKLTQDEMKLATQFNLKNKEIKNLKGIELFKDHLAVLDVSGNPIKQIPSLSEFSKLNSFIFKDTELEIMPEIPDTVSHLNVDGVFNSIPKLPAKLESLLVYAPVTSLPTPLPSTLTNLNIYNRTITSISGLPNGITNLYCPNIHFNDIRPLPSNLTSLSCIFDTANEINSLPKTSLESLNFEYGNVDILDLEGFTALERLSCDNNNIKEIRNIPNSLTSLSCRDNLIKNLDLSKSQIADLSCGSNELTSINVTGLPLTSFACQFNRLASKSEVIGFASDWNETTFVFGKQRLDEDWTDIELSNSCKEIIVNTETILLINLIKNSNPASFHIPESKIIYEIEGINTAEAIIKRKVHSSNREIIAKKPGEITLKVTIKNHKGSGEDFVKRFSIKVIDGQSSSSGEVITSNFKDQKFLKEIRIALKKSPDADIYTNDNLDKILDLALTEKEITDLSGIEYLTRLETLFLFDNKLTKLPENLPSSLKEITCSRNNIKEIKKLPEYLEKLDCSSNPNLTKIEAIFPSTLKKLDVSSCKLNNIPALPNQLEELRAGNNNLTSLPKLPVTLTKLEVPNNQISSLNLTGLTKLNSLSCVNNRIKNKGDIQGFDRYWDGFYFMYSPQNGDGYDWATAQVRNIEGIPSSGTSPMTLNGNILSDTASQKEIHWIVVNANNTGAKITGNTLTAHSDGTVTIKGIIYKYRSHLNEVNSEQLYSKEFTIRIKGDGTSGLPNSENNTGNSNKSINNGNSGGSASNSHYENPIINILPITTEESYTENKKKNETINKNKEIVKDNQSDSVKIDNKKKLTFSISQSEISKALKEKKKLFVQLKKASVTIDKNTVLKKLNSNDKLDISIKSSKIKETQLSMIDKTKLLNKQVYNIHVKLNGKDFNEKVMVSIKTKIKEIGKNEIIMKDLNTGKTIKAKYDKKTKSVLFKTNKPGKYIILKK